MSSFPDAFRINCVGKLPCNTNYNNCSNKPVVLENNRVIHETNTTHCKKYSVPKNVIQDNIIDYNVSSVHTWSNARGYGNIVVCNNDSNNNILGRKHPYNRIPALHHEYSGLKNHAWNNNKDEYNKCK